METSFSNIKGMYRANTDIINKAIADVKAEDWFRQPGDDSNHLLWLLGHVVVHRGMVLKMVGAEWSAPWASLFSRGVERVDAAQYPSIEEMREAWSQISEQLKSTLNASPAEVLEKPAPEGSPSFDKKMSGMVAFLAFHDTYHTGQISFLRKWLGYGQTIG
ncbi:MAG TPA: DinB family protein [Pyrinomonadaceae bacterium]|nr:DinB family protein [Pyrinomonadaceae bacterium]